MRNVSIPLDAALNGPQWKRAADCEGWPTHPGRKARRGEVNFPAIDCWTVGHFAVGAILGSRGASFAGAAAYAVGWELLERPLKRHLPEVFPHATQDTAANAITDALAVVAGWLFASRK